MGIDVGALIIILIMGILLILTFYIIGVYNKLLDVRNKAIDKFNPIDTELNRLGHLLSDLVKTIKNDIKYEDKLIMEIDTIAGEIINANSINNKIKLFEQSLQVIDKLINLLQTYPKLKSNNDFKKFQKDINQIKNKINYASPFYNDMALNYNNLINEFPANIVAMVFKFTKLNYFKWINGDIGGD